MKTKKIKLTCLLVCLSVFVFAQTELFRPYSGGGIGVVVCGCYYNSDCSAGVHCDYKKIKCEKRGKFDGNCTKNSFEFWNNGLPENITREIARRFDLWFESLPSPSIGGPPDPRLVELAMETGVLTTNQVELIKLHFLGLIMPSWVGHKKPTNLPARIGFWLHGGDVLDPNGAELFPNGYLLPISEELSDIGKLIHKGITTSILTGKKKHYHKAFEKIRNKYSTISSFGRCEFPHPSEHGHDFPYNDEIECLELEVEPAISALFKDGDPTALNTNINEEILLTASPNPFSSNASVVFAAIGGEETQEHQAILTVQDITGSFTKILWQGNLSANEQQLQSINASDLNGYGTYILTLILIDNGLSEQIRIVLFP